MTEHVLPYDHSIVPQETGWWCGPASTQVVLNGRGVIKSEQDLANEIGTTYNGTNQVGMITPILNKYTGAGYLERLSDGDPMSQAQKDLLWSDVTRSIDAGFGCVVNIDAPVSNYPRGVKGSPSPSYGNGEVLHYIAIMGYDDDPAVRAVWVADSGFRPFGYWCSFDQMATLIPPKGWTAAVPIQEMSGMDAETLSRAMGGSLSIERYRQLLPAVNDALLQADCTTVDRVAMWFAQVGHESSGLRYMQEIADGSDYEGRADLGNTQPGDGRRFKGHGPIQITGRFNHAAVSAWAFGRGLVPTVTYFVDNPDELAGDQYGFLGVTWYWTVARNMNIYSDAGDIDGATQAVNGGLNGITDRTDRWNNCRAMGAEILPTQGVDDMAGVDADRLNQAVDRILGVVLSRETDDPRIHESARPNGAAGVADALDVRALADGIAALSTKLDSLPAAIATAIKGK